MAVAAEDPSRSRRFAWEAGVLHGGGCALGASPWAASSEVLPEPAAAVQRP